MHNGPMSANPQPINVAVFVSGRGSNLKALLDAKAAGRLPRVNFALVFSDKEHPPAFDHARAHGITARSLRPKSFGSKQEYEAAAVALMREAGVDWIVLAGYMRLVGPTLLEAFPMRIVNIHPALLPSFPGLHAQRQAIDCGVKISGCTVHFVDAGMDTGPIIMQRAVECRAEDTEETLSARILAEEHKAFPDALELISEGRVRVDGRIVKIGA